jgi:acylpyruvate hydrolase
MRLVRYRAAADSEGLAIATPDGYKGLDASHARYPGALEALLVQSGEALRSAAGTLTNYGGPIDIDQVHLLPPIVRPGKIICVGLNYMDHSAETGLPLPDYPVIFARFPSGLIGHRAPIVRPTVSTALDYEGELAVIIGSGGRRISRTDALAHVAGYSAFNDASIRDYQFRTSQWTVGKNFDATGAFGPAFVTAEELPPGCSGCSLQTRVNGRVVQSAAIDDMIFDVAVLIELMSDVMTLFPADVIVTGTPAGVGFARKPPVYLQAGDVCEVEIDDLGILRNPVVDEASG